MSHRAFSYAQNLRPGFLAHMANRLDALICGQTEAMLQDAGVVTPVRSVSTMIYLRKCGPASLADIAAADRQSHQLVSSRVGPLEELGLVTRTIDKNDRRRKLLKLTAKGRADSKIIERVCEQIALGLDHLRHEINLDLMSAIEEAETRLKQMPIELRSNTHVHTGRRVRRTVTNG